MKWSLDQEPQKVYEYVYFYPGDGEVTHAYIGIFEGPGGSVIRDYSQVNGADWVHKLPERANLGFCPVYRMQDLSWNDRKNARILVFQTEEEADQMADFYRESPQDYVCVSMMPGVRRNVDTGLFQGREVIIWPHKDASGDKFLSWMYSQIGKVSSVFLRAKIDVLPSGATALTALKGSVMDVMVGIQDAYKPEAESSSATLVDGFSDLRIPANSLWVEKVKGALCNDKGVIECEYDNLMQVCEMDPAFKDLVKHDRATGQMAWSPVYRSYDELDNAILNRFREYDIRRPGRDMRADIIKSLSLQEHAVINTIENVFAQLEQKYINPESRLSWIVEQIEFENPRDKGVYLKLLEHFFIRAALHSFRAFGEQPVPNDIVPIFVGKQGSGKSRLCRYLAMADKYFCDLGDKGVTLGSPDCIRHITGKLIVEMSEMTPYKKTEVNTVKAFISQTVDEFRQVYERGMTKVPRVANLIGTTNEDRFLRDTTGNRRFFPIKILKIDHEELFKHPSWIEETWTYYWMVAKASPLDFWDKLPTELVSFFEKANAESMDLGVTADITDSVIDKIECDVYASRVLDSKTTMILTAKGIADALVEKGYPVPRNLSEIVRALLTTRGYKSQTVWDDRIGKVQWGYKIAINDEKLVARCGKAVKEPEF